MNGDGSTARKLVGKRSVLSPGDELFPKALARIPRPPEELYVVGNPGALEEGLAIVGARKATPYGKGCARRFALQAAERGIVVISGGALGCDSAAHEAALEAGTPTVAFLGGGCDRIYPARNAELFQRIVDGGGAVVSELPWDCHPVPFAFRERNRLIAGLARATLIVEAGMPSGTFSTADEALSASREVFAVPGSITSSMSRGANQLIAQGATPIIDDDSFQDALFMVFGFLKQDQKSLSAPVDDPLFDALCAEPCSVDDLYSIALAEAPSGEVASWLATRLSELELEGLIVRGPGGRYSARVDRGR